MQPEARARIIARISWLTGRGQQSDSYIAGSNHAIGVFWPPVARLLLGRCSQTRAFPAVSRRELSADLTCGAHRRRADFSDKVQTPPSACILGASGVNVNPTCDKYEIILKERCEVPPGHLLLALAEYVPDLKDLKTSGLNRQQHEADEQADPPTPTKRGRTLTYQRQGLYAE